MLFLNRRRILSVSAALAALAAWPLGADAAGYPDRPIYWVVPYGPGSSTDLMARLLAEKVSPILGQRVLVENRAGGAGLIGTEHVARSDPDGYTLVLGANNTHAVAVSLFTNLKYDPLKSFQPVALLVSQPQVVVVSPEMKVRSMPELVAYAKANPGKLNFASTGVGTGAHLAPETFKHAAGLDIVHVPYTGGGKAIPDLVANQVQLMFYPYMPLKGFIDAGKLVPLATTGHDRSPWLPNLPTMIELGYKDFAFPSWYGVYAPAGTPAAVVKTLSDAFGRVLRDPEVLANLAKNGTVAKYEGPEGLAKFTAFEIERYKKVLAEAAVPKVSN